MVANERRGSYRADLKVAFVCERKAAFLEAICFRLVDFNALIVLALVLANFVLTTFVASDSALAPAMFAVFAVFNAAISDFFWIAISFSPFEFVLFFHFP